ncbi:MAG: butyrate kinase [Firmicutes bacterium]|mgnify:CR=1 FL=1|jgi:butyrate kinase|nr:butyrate kinase [Bacillota bacterium]
MKKRILAVNTGSTSTEVQLWDGLDIVAQAKISHTERELIRDKDVFDQFDLRYSTVLKFLSDNNVEVKTIDAIAVRGGRLRPLESGVYRVNEKMLHHCKIGFQGDHPSNLASHVAKKIAEPYGIPMFVVDPITVDELDPIARISGYALIERTSLSHALNMKAVAYKYCDDYKKNYKECKIIVCHVGGGGSVSLHVNGRMIDLYNSDKEGAFSVERSGGLPTIELVELCYSGKYDKTKMIRFLSGEGGLYSYLKTRDSKEIEARIKGGDKDAELIYKAMAYQFAKSIGALATAVNGEVDVILITGGVAWSDMFVGYLIPRIEFIAPVIKYPGGFEMEALVTGVLEALEGKREIKEY